MFFVTFKDDLGTYLLNYLYCISPSDSEGRNNVEIPQNRYSAVREVTAMLQSRRMALRLCGKGCQYNPLNQLRNSFICVLDGHPVLSCWVIVSLESKEMLLKDRRPQAVWLSSPDVQKTRSSFCARVIVFLLHAGWEHWTQVPTFACAPPAVQFSLPTTSISWVVSVTQGICFYWLNLTGLLCPNTLLSAKSVAQDLR